MNKTPHGFAVIINNYKFTSANSDKLLPNSRGTWGDKQNLCATWRYLHYNVHTLENLTASEITHDLTQIASLSHENYDSFVCCILSHGDHNGVYGTDGELVKISDIASLFKCTPTLAGKPKLFFIHSYCGYVATKDTVVTGNVDPYHFLPDETDSFFGCAISMSWRSRSKYISTFREVIKRYATHEHLLNLLTIINYKVLESNTILNDQESCKHCPASVTPLHKEVWFFKNQM